MTESHSTSADKIGVETRLKRRRREEQRFRFYGLAAIVAAASFLTVLLVSIVVQAFPAITHYKIEFETELDPAILAPNGADDEAALAENVAGFYRLLREDLSARFLDPDATRAERIELFGLVTRLAVIPVAQDVAANPQWLGAKKRFSVALSDDVDLYLKGRATRQAIWSITGPHKSQASPDGTVSVSLSAQAIERLKRVTPWAASGETFAIGAQSVLVRQGHAVLRVLEIGEASLTGELLTGQFAPEAARALEVRLLGTPETERNVTDKQIAWTLALMHDGRLKRGLHTTLLTNADSTYPEIAGVFAALAGSFFTMVMTAALALPIGVMAAIYLEEFAAKNRFTDLIEVNINNLAAVPSIVFGLLGAAVFLSWLGLPRSAPLVGGLVLALMTLPTVIIASRAALKSVPQSIRDAALGVGASKTQAVLHHVLPLAAPGILTGAIIGLARALGETAPLLLIGMVAFVAETPRGVTDEATVLPVLVFKWSTGAERAWEPATAAAILILLFFMVVMNAAAVLIRSRLERRW
ncbi:MAG: phosphate ABC transporter permease PstA [Pseudomonadota bacterium]